MYGAGPRALALALASGTSAPVGCLGGMLRRSALVAFVMLLWAVPQAGHAQDEPPLVAMAQLPGKEGCLSVDEDDAAVCKELRFPISWGSVAITEDGRNVYGIVPASDGGAVVVFKRDRFTGALSEQSCLSALPLEGCDVEPGVDKAWHVAASPDRSNLYVATSTGLVVFARDRTTGELEKIQCLSTDVVAGCDQVPLRGRSLVPPDGRHVYSGGRLFDRDPSTGELSNPRCAYAVEPDEDCPSLNIGELSADGRYAYTWSESVGAGYEGIAVYSRDPATGVLSKVPCPAEPYGCVRPHEGYFSDVAAAPDGRNVVAVEWFPERGWLFNFDADPASGTLWYDSCFKTGGEPGLCTEVPALDNPVNVEVAPDGQSVYVPSGSNWANVGGMSTFARDPATGDLSLAGCVTEDGDDGACVIGHAIGGARLLAVSPDSRNVYVVVGRSIGVLGLAVDIAPEELPVYEEGEVRPQLMCPGGQEECDGTVSLRTLKRVRVQVHGHWVKRRVKVGSKRFAIDSGDTKRVRIRLEKRARRLLRRSARVRTRARVAAENLPGRTVRDLRLRRR